MGWGLSIDLSIACLDKGTDTGTGMMFLHEEEDTDLKGKESRAK